MINEDYCKLSLASKWLQMSSKNRDIVWQRKGVKRKECKKLRRSNGQTISGDQNKKVVCLISCPAQHSLHLLWARLFESDGLTERERGGGFLNREGREWRRGRLPVRNPPRESRPGLYSYSSPGGIRRIRRVFHFSLQTG